MKAQHKTTRTIAGLLAITTIFSAGSLVVFAQTLERAVDQDVSDATTATAAGSEAEAEADIEAVDSPAEPGPVEPLTQEQIDALIAERLRQLSGAQVSVQAEARQRVERVNRLRESLDQVGAAVRDARNLNREERAALLEQLVGLSRTLIELQRAGAFASLRVPGTGSAITPGGVSTDEIGLHRIVVEYDVTANTDRAVVTELYLDSDDNLAEDPLGVTFRRVSYPIIFEIEPQGTDFADIVNAVREMSAPLIAEHTNIANPLEVEQKIMMSVSDPRREERLPRNKEEREELTTEFEAQFGVNTIVDTVFLNRGDTAGGITMSTDQGEVLLSSVKRNGRFYFPPNPTSLFDRRPYYDSTYTYYGTPSRALNRAVLSETTENITQEEVLEFFQFAFSGVPFVEQIDLADMKLLQVLTNNPTYYQSGFNFRQIRVEPYITGNGTERVGVVECIVDGDRAILNGYVLDILDGLGINYILDELAIQYPARIENVSSDESSGCRDRAAFF